MYINVYMTTETDINTVKKNCVINAQIPVYTSVNNNTNTNFLVAGELNPMYEENGAPQYSHSIFFKMFAKLNLLEMDYFGYDVGKVFEYEMYCYPCYRENGGYKIVDGIVIKPYMRIQVHSTQAWNAKILRINYRCETQYAGENLSASASETYITDSTNLPTYDYYGGQAADSVASWLRFSSYSFGQQGINNVPPGKGYYPYYSWLLSDIGTSLHEITPETLKTDFNIYALTPYYQCAGTISAPVQSLNLYQNYSQTKARNCFIAMYKALAMTSLPEEEDETETTTPDYDDTSDDIERSTLPVINMSKSFIKSYILNDTEMATLSSNIWNLSGWEQITSKMTGSKPTDFIVSMKVYPSNVPIYTDSTSLINLGFWQSAEAYNIVKDRYTTFDCGTLELKKYFGNYLDYNSTVSIYLPFIGTRQLNVNEVMGGSINPIYYIDLLTGDCVVQIYVNNTIDKTQLKGVLYQFNGNIGIEIPVNSNAYSNAYISTAFSCAAGLSAIYAPESSIGMAMLSNTANEFVRSQGVQKSGSITSNSGILSILTPYLVIERPIWVKAKNYDKLHGYRNELYKNLSNLEGYAVIKDIKLNIKGALKEEKEEIERLLKSGVYF